MQKILWLIILGISVILSAFLMAGAKKGEPFWGDYHINNWISELFSESSHPFFEVITQLGDKLGIGIVAILMLIWLWGMKKDYIGIAVLLLGVILANEASKVLKEFIGRERPASAGMAETLSFPSGHAMVGLTLFIISNYLLITNLNSKKWKWIIGVVSFTLIFLIGLSRMVLQEHFPTDVLGGYALGLVWTILWLFLYEWMSNRFTKRKSRQAPLNT